MIIFTQAEWDAIPPEQRAVWSVELTDWKDWDKLREKYIGKRTLNRGGALLVEGINFIVDAEPAHTPTPWLYFDYEGEGEDIQSAVVDSEGFTICPPIKQRDARYICRAANSHDGLVAALQACVHAIDNISTVHAFHVHSILESAHQALTQAGTAAKERE